MRVGLIGAGRIGAVHAEVLAGTGGVEEVIVFDSFGERASELAEKIDLAIVGDQEAVFAADAVVIASSTDTHTRYLHQAAESRIPTFCEKPISLDLASTREAVVALDESGVTVMMGFQRRYDEGITSIKHALDTGPPPYLVRSQTHDPSPPPLDYIPVSGGIFKDCLVHDIDAVRFVTGQEVVAVTATGTATGHPDIAALGDYGSAVALLEMSEGTMAQISGLRYDPVGYDVRLEVFGSTGAWAAGWNDQTPIVPTDSGSEAPVSPIADYWDRFANAYRAEMTAFVEVVRGNAQPASTHRDAEVALVVAEACDIAAAESRRVEVSEILP